ncbi:MAG TPA: FHA domain-containing protein [Capsulimonadaceae bacterium]|jgi:pSer/pThr/pTyr-binding forkhead associated (FHA) protein
MAGFGQDPVPGMPLPSLLPISSAPPDTVPELNWKVKVLNGPQAGSSYDLQRGDNVIGRNDPPSVIVDVDLTEAELGDPPMLSRRHLKATVDANTLILEDLQSTNGSFVSGEKLPANSPRSIASRAVKARLANIDMEFTADAA